MITPASNSANRNGSNPVAQVLTNEFKAKGELTLALSNDGGGGTLSKVYLFEGYTPNNPKIGGSQADGTHTTLTSADLSSTASEVVDYTKNVKGHCGNIVIQTDDTDNFTGGNKLVVGRVQPDGRTEESDIRLDKYKTVDGQSLSDTITIDDVNLLLGGNFYMYLKSLKSGTTCTFIFTIDGTNEASLITKRS